jgi:hypothetical protein
MLRLEIRRRPDAVAIEIDERGAREREQNGRMGGDEKLRMSWRRQIVNDPQKRELTLAIDVSLSSHRHQAIAARRPHA